MPLMVPILSILWPKQPLRDVDPAFLMPDLCLLGAGLSFRRRAHIPLARVSMRKSRSSRIRERTASNRLSLSSDSRNSASSSPSKLLRDWETERGRKRMSNVAMCKQKCWMCGSEPLVIRGNWTECWMEVKVCVFKAHLTHLAKTRQSGN